MVDVAGGVAKHLTVNIILSIKGENIDIPRGYALGTFGFGNSFPYMPNNPRVFCDGLSGKRHDLQYVTSLRVRELSSYPPTIAHHARRLRSGKKQVPDFMGIQEQRDSSARKMIIKGDFYCCV